MNDLGVFAIGGYHTIDGVQYHLTPLTAADFAEARAFIRTLSPDPMEGVVDMCNALASQETGKALIVEAYHAREKWGSWTDGIGAIWASGYEGCAFWFYCTTRTHHPELTKEACKEIVVKAGNENQQKLMNMILDISGLAPNPTKTPPSTTKRKTKRKRK